MPRYCLFGNTIAVASKMEAYSEPGLINISADAVRFVRSIVEHRQVLSNTSCTSQAQGIEIKLDAEDGVVSVLVDTSWMDLQTQSTCYG